MTTEETDRIHDRLDQVVESNTDIVKLLAEIKAACKPCREMVAAHQATLHGNGRNGLVTQVATVKSGRVDTMSVKSVVALITAVCGGVATIIGSWAVLGN